MSSTISYKSEFVRHCVEKWEKSHPIDVVQRLSGLLVDVDWFEAEAAVIVEAKEEADTLCMKLSSNSWTTQRELVVLPSGEVAW
jgi:hypothetical protein